MYPHQIRLRGPWECEPLRSENGGAVPARLRMNMPCRWADGGLPGFAGRVRFVRRFGLPRQIDAHERLWLRFAGLTGSAELCLNGELLGSLENTGGEFEVTSRLRDRNELLAEMSGGSDGGLWGEVALVIRASAHLTQLRRTPDGAAGMVVGTAERPLDVYLLHAGKSAAHTMVQPLPTGQEFSLTALESTASAGAEVRIELINGGVVWDSQVIAKS